MQAHKMDLPPLPRLRISAISAILLFAAMLAGCAQSIPTQLPDLKRPEADGMLVPAQQKKAIEEMAQKRAEAEAQAVKQIEQTR
jgi:ABC-type uncharacterized transport system auxiliary subunit